MTIRQSRLLRAIFSVKLKENFIVTVILNKSCMLVKGDGNEKLHLTSIDYVCIELPCMVHGRGLG